VESAEYDGTYTAEALGNAQALIDVVFEARQVKVHFASDDDVVEIVYDAELHQP
jgi:hypothetical protein